MSESNKTNKPFHRLAQSEKAAKKRLIVVLEKASLETVKVGKVYELLNCDKHKHMMKRLRRDAAACRPDITHQCLLMLMDSPLNRAGLLQVYIHTEQHVLIEINPQTRIPRTFDRFCGLMVQLLHKLSIHANDGPQKLLKVIKNPINDHLPIGCRKYAATFHTENVVKDLKTLATAEGMDEDSLRRKDEPVVIVIGTMARGSVDVDYTEKDISFSRYPLSGALACAKLCSAFETAWDVE